MAHLNSEQAQELIRRLFYRDLKFVVGSKVVVEDGQRGILFDVMVPVRYPDGKDSRLWSLRHSGMPMREPCSWTEAQVSFQVGPNRVHYSCLITDIHDPKRKPVMTDIRIARSAAFEKLTKFFPAGPDGKIVVGGRRIAQGFNEGEVMFVGVPVEGYPGLMTLADALALRLHADAPTIFWERTNINFVDAITTQPKLCGPMEMNEPSASPLRGTQVWEEDFTDAQLQLQERFNLGEMPATFRTIQAFASELHGKIAELQANYSGKTEFTGDERHDFGSALNEICLLAIAGKVSLNRDVFER